MASELKVPSLGMDMEEATISRWLVSDGDEVNSGDPVLEIDTDKAMFEVEASDSGVLRNPCGEPGEVLPVGATLAYIAAPDEELPEPPDQTEPASEEQEEAPASASWPESSESAPAPSSDPDGYRGKVRASPAARRAAVKRELRIEDLAGSGPGGRVYLSDVLNAYVEDAPQLKSTPAEPEPQPEEPSAGGEATEAAESAESTEKLSRIRRIAGERTAKSFSEAPHFYLQREFEADRLLELRERLREKLEPVPTVTDLVSLAVARSLGEHPRLNARYTGGDELRLNEQVHLGIAVATDDGLLVPVFRNVNTLPLKEIAAGSRDLIQRARQSSLRSDELSGSTFTISNLGMMGVDSFQAVINPPEAAILAVGKTRTVPEWRGGEWVPKNVMSVTLSVDHRVADGADGAAFLQSLQTAISDWEILL